MAILVDTNILLRISDRDSADHDTCVNALRTLISRGEICHTCLQVLIEFWVVATRPRDVNGLGMSVEEAMASLNDYQQSMPCLPEPPGIAQIWQGLVAKHKVLGKKAHDTRLVALMTGHGIVEILTLNGGDFSRFKAVGPVSPRDIRAVKP